MRLFVLNPSLDTQTQIITEHGGSTLNRTSPWISSGGTYRVHKSSFDTSLHHALPGTVPDTCFAWYPICPNIIYWHVKEQASVKGEYRPGITHMTSVRQCMENNTGNSGWDREIEGFVVHDVRKGFHH